MFQFPNGNSSVAKCLSCPAHIHGPCQAADPETLRTIAQASFPSSYTKGSTIIPQGDNSDYVGIITSGIVKLTNVSSDGRQTVVSLLEKGNVIGNITGPYSRFSYEAASPVSTCSISRDTFKEILSVNPAFSYRVLELTSRQAEEVLEWLTLFNCRTTIQRLAGYLHALAISRLAEHPGKRVIIDIPIGRKDLAAYLGTTPETLSRNFHQLADLRVLTIVNASQVVIDKVQRLRAIARQSSEELQSLSGGNRRREHADRPVLPLVRSGTN